MAVSGLSDTPIAPSAPSAQRETASELANFFPLPCGKEQCSEKQFLSPSCSSLPPALPPSIFPCCSHYSMFFYFQLFLPVFLSSSSPALTHWSCFFLLVVFFFERTGSCLVGKLVLPHHYLIACDPRSERVCFQSTVLAATERRAWIARRSAVALFRLAACGDVTVPHVDFENKHKFSAQICHEWSLGPSVD